MPKRMRNFFSVWLNGTHRLFSPAVFKQNDCRRGFTVVELLITAVITALLSAVLITYNSNSRRQVALTVERTKLAQIILRSKSLAISTYNQPGAPCGYGVHLDYAARIYAIVSYTVPNCANLSQIPSNTVEMERHALDPNLRFNVNNCANSVSDVLFVPPDPKTYLGDVISQFISPGPGRICLITQDGSVTSQVVINSAGQVTF